MAKTMIETNRALFARLERLLPHEQVKSSDVKIGETSIRHIKTDKDEENVLKNAVIVGECQVHEAQAIFGVSFDGRKYVIITDPSTWYDDLLPTVSKFDPATDLNTDNSGLMTLLLASQYYPFAKDDQGYELLDTVFCREGIKDGEFDLSEISKFFQPPLIWKAADELNISSAEVLKGIYAAYFLRNPEKKAPLSFSNESEFQFLAVLENLNIELLGSRMYRSLFSLDWKYSFLDAYQCVEYLFSIPYLVEFAHSLTKPELLPELYANTEPQLNWRPKEEEALTRLIRELNDNATEQAFKLCFESVEKVPWDPKTDTKSAIAKRIYQLRNSTAHFRKALAVQEPDAKQSDELLTQMLKLIVKLYFKYGTEIQKITALAA